MRQESKGTKIKKVLDLDSSDSFDENFIKIVYDPKVIDIIRKDRHQSNEIIQGLHSTGGDDDNDFVHNLRSQIDETIRQKYTHVAAYHGCRIEESAEYNKYGLQPSTKKLLFKKAKDIFVNQKKIDSVLNKTFSQYGLGYDGTISFYTTAKYAPITYLNGSHYLRIVASELGSQAEQQLKLYHQKCIPAFIKCFIPIKWLDDQSFIKIHYGVNIPTYIPYYSSTLLRILISKKIDVSKGYGEAYDGLVLLASIPPEDIEILKAEDVCETWQEEMKN